MKTIIILKILVASLILTSCEDTAIQKEETNTETKNHNITQDNHEVYLIDGCQYVVYRDKVGINLGYGFMSHKGNCNNTIHCYHNHDSILNSTEIMGTINNNTAEQENNKLINSNN